MPHYRKQNPLAVAMGKRVAEVRNYLGVSQRKFADAYEDVISRGTLAKYETGLNFPSPEFLSRLAAIENINLNWLYSGNGSMFIDDG